MDGVTVTAQSDVRITRGSYIGAERCTVVSNHSGQLSSADVSSMVEDRVHGGFFRLKHALDGRTIAHTRTKEVLGPTMLRSIRHSEDPLVVRISLQACMARFARWIVTIWHVAVSNNQDLLADIHSQMCKSGNSTFVETASPIWLNHKKQKDGIGEWGRRLHN